MYKRLFIAIKIDPTEEILRRVYYLKQNLSEENINWIPYEHYHLTLQFLGKTAVSIINELQFSLKNVLLNKKSFDLSIGETALFGSTYAPKVIWIKAGPQNELNNLHHHIQESMMPFGFRNDRQNFVPHLSIARIRKLKNKEHFKRVMEKLPQQKIVYQRIEEVVLYESVLHSRGAQYMEIGRFPLA